MKVIKRTGMWLLMLTKRYLKNPIFLITILVIPLVVAALRFTTGTDEAAVRVALCVKGQDSLSTQAVESLTDNDSSVISFYRVTSEEEAYENVESGTAVCAYVFPNNFEEMVEKYVTGDRGELAYNGHLVKCIRAEETNYSKITEELVFASFYQKFANEVLKDFMEEYRESFTEKDWKNVQAYYNDYSIEAEFFRFEYIDGSENTLMTQQKTSFLLLPVRGLILLLILLAAMTGGVISYRDKERGLFQSITVNRRGMLNYSYVLIPAVIAAGAGLAGIWFANIWTNVSREIICMTLYVFFVTGVCNLVRRVCRNGLRFASIIPLFLMFNMVFCPVFVDLSPMLPQIKYIQPILPVFYGLSCLYDNGVKIMMLIVGAILLAFVWIGHEAE